MPTKSPGDQKHSSFNHDQESVIAEFLSPDEKRKLEADIAGGGSSSRDVAGGAGPLLQPSSTADYPELAPLAQRLEWAISNLFGARGRFTALEDVAAGQRQEIIAVRSCLVDLLAHQQRISDHLGIDATQPLDATQTLEISKSPAKVEAGQTHGGNDQTVKQPITSSVPPEVKALLGRQKRIEEAVNEVLAQQRKIAILLKEGSITQVDVPAPKTENAQPAPPLDATPKSPPPVPPLQIVDVAPPPPPPLPPPTGAAPGSNGNGQIARQLESSREPAPMSSGAYSAPMSSGSYQGGAAAVQTPATPAAAKAAASPPKSRLVLSSDLVPGMLNQDKNNDGVLVLLSSRCLSDATEDTFYNDKSAPSLPPVFEKTMTPSETSAKVSAASDSANSPSRSESKSPHHSKSLPVTPTKNKTQGASILLGKGKEKRPKEENLNAKIWVAADEDDNLDQDDQDDKELSKHTTMPVMPLFVVPPSEVSSMSTGAGSTQQLNQPPGASSSELSSMTTGKGTFQLGVCAQQSEVYDNHTGASHSLKIGEKRETQKPSGHELHLDLTAAQKSALLAKKVFQARNKGDLDSLGLGRTTTFVVSTLMEEESGEGIRGKVAKVVRHTYFHFFIGTMISFNSILIGARTEWAMQNTELGGDHVTEPQLFHSLEICFTAIFSVEICARLYVESAKFFCNDRWKWNWFDCMVVGVSITELVAQSFVGENNRVLQSLRLVRVVRLIRVMRFLSGLQRIVVMITGTLRSLLWAMMLLLLVAFLLGVYLLQVLIDAMKVKADDPNTLALMEHFSSIPRTFYTLFKAISSGIDWGELGDPLWELNVLGCMFFCMYIAFAVFCILNVVTGAFVNVEEHTPQNVSFRRSSNMSSAGSESLAAAGTSSTASTTSNASRKGAGRPKRSK